MNDAVRARRELARSLSRIHRATVHEALAEFDDSTGTPGYRIGITGAAGAGKSTLISRLAPRRLARLDPAMNLAVLAIDPTSPRSHGAILGDRIRMDAISTDPRLLIRSLASRHAGGGLTDNIVDLLAAIDRHGRYPESILETVGVGQSEHAVRCLVDTLVLVLHPQAGDAIQAMKAGIVELADIFVVSKAELPGAERTAADLRATLAPRPSVPVASEVQGWDPPVLCVRRDDEHGIEALDSALEAHRHWCRTHVEPATLQARRRGFHLRSLLARRVLEIMDEDEAGIRNLADWYRDVVARLQADAVQGKTCLLAGHAAKSR